MFMLIISHLRWKKILYSILLCYMMRKVIWLIPCQIFVKKASSEKNLTLFVFANISSLCIFRFCYLWKVTKNFSSLSLIIFYTASPSQKAYFDQVTSVGWLAIYGKCDKSLMATLIISGLEKSHPRSSAVAASSRIIDRETNFQKEELESGGIVAPVLFPVEVFPD